MVVVSDLVSPSGAVKVRTELTSTGLLCSEAEPACVAALVATDVETAVLADDELVSEGESEPHAAREAASASAMTGMARGRRMGVSTSG